MCRAKYSAFANPRTMDELVMGAKRIEEVLVNEKAPTTTKNTTPQQPPRCQYCPERHFHKDCPELQRLRDASGNGRGAGFARGSSRETAGPSQINAARYGDAYLPRIADEPTFQKGRGRPSPSIIWDPTRRHQLGTSSCS
jgi:hypothetical protein